MQLSVLSCAEHLNIQTGAVQHTLTLSLGDESFDVLVGADVYATISGLAQRQSAAIPAKMPIPEVEHTFGGDYVSEPLEPKTAPVVYADDWGNPIVPAYTQEMQSEDPDAEVVPSI